MRRTVVIVPELLGDPSVLRDKLPTIERMTELGNLSKLSPTPTVETPEALYVGFRPDEGQLRQGPLTISALGADPPPRSTHFHLSLMSFDDDIAHQPKVEIAPEEQRQVMELAKKLDTKLLTVVEGEGLDHGLVWESVGDLQTTPASEVDGKPTRPALPQGDAEALLRRFIDDSINLLSEIEMNQRRIDEDLPPLNLLWPWGEGVRQPVPNLALKRGEPALVMSSSLRLEGLTRLVGYRHSNRKEFGQGLNTRLAKIAERVLSEPVAIVLLDAVAGFREKEQLEEADWFVRELEEKLLEPLFEAALLNQSCVTLLAPGKDMGLGMTFTTGDQNAGIYPFDERSLQERVLSTFPLWEFVPRAL